MTEREEQLLQLFRNADARAQDDAIRVLQLHQGDGRITLQAMMTVKGVSAQQVSGAAGMEIGVFQDKLEGRKEFTQGEISAIVQALDLSRHAIREIFFS